MHTFRDMSASMMINQVTISEEHSDTELVARSLDGDRDAFSRIVLRYQTLICSLAYSRSGNLGQSEDIAQETFIAAWKQLRLLREPAKLRAWLCGIVRNRTLKNLHRERHEPAHHAEPLETVHDFPSNEALPSEQAISRDEEAILWRSVENIPEIYREPLILFYREHQSVEAVAAELELSEDAVKQRLSRGRKLLQEEVQAFVENTLRRTAPGRAFSGAVLAALPAVPASTVGVSVAGKGAAAAKSGFLGTWLAPIVGIPGGIAAHWLIARSAPTDRERRLKKFAFTGLWIFVLAWCVAGQLAMRALHRHMEWSEQTFFAAMAGFWWFYAIVIATFGIVMFRRILAIRQDSETTAEVPYHSAKPLKISTRIAVVTGVYLACFWWLVELARQAGDHASVGVIAGIMVMLGGWHFFQLRGKTGVSASRAVAGQLALVWGVILMILNVRLERWEAALHGIDLAEMHRLLPIWIIPFLSLSVAAWVYLLLKITKPNCLRK